MSDRGGRQRLAYLPLFVRDFLSDPLVMGMRWLDQALYLRMLMASWEAGPLPVEPWEIGRLVDKARLDGELEAFGAEFDVADAIQSVLNSCWERVDGGWVNARLERERSRALDLQRKRSEGGSHGNARRWDRSAIGERSVSDRTPIASQAQAQIQTQEKNQKKNPPTPRRKTRAKKTADQGPGPETVPIQTILDTEEFRPLWAEWIEHRARTDPMTARAAELALMQLQRMGHDRAVAALRNSLQHPKWTSIYEPKNEQATNGTHLTRPNPPSGRRPDGTREGEYPEPAAFPRIFRPGRTDEAPEPMGGGGPPSPTSRAS